MSATYDGATERAAFGEALVRETVNTLSSWLTKDSAVLPGSTADEGAEYLLLYYTLIIAGRRRGFDGLNNALAYAHDIVESLGEAA